MLHHGKDSGPKAGAAAGVEFAGSGLFFVEGKCCSVLPAGCRAAWGQVQRPEAGRAGGARPLKHSKESTLCPTLVRPLCPGSRGYAGKFKKTLKAIYIQNALELDKV